MSATVAGVERYFREAVAYVAEGVVIKAATGPYQAGKRGWLWLKFKREYHKQVADTFDLARSRCATRQRLSGGNLRIIASCFVRSCHQQILYPDEGRCGVFRSALTESTQGS